MNITPNEHSQLVSCIINGDFSPLKKDTLAEVLFRMEKEFQSKCEGTPIPGKASKPIGNNKSIDMGKYKQFKHMESNNLVFIPKSLVGDADIACVAVSKPDSVTTTEDDVWIVVATDGESKGNIVDTEV